MDVNLIKMRVMMIYPLCVWPTALLLFLHNYSYKQYSLTAIWPMGMAA